MAEGDGPKELREYADREKARADQAEAKLKELGLRGAGVDPSKGIGRAALSSYTGDFSDVDAIRSHLRDEYDWQPKEAEAPAPSEDNTEANRLGENIAQSQGRIAEANQGQPPSGGGGQGATLDQQIAAAEAEGRWADAGNLKAEKILGLMERRP